MSGDKPYYNLAVPLPLTSFAQEKLGMLELDSVDGTAIVSHGDILIDNGCSVMSFNTSDTPSLSFNGSSLNVSATTVSLNGGLVLSNVSNVSQSRLIIVPHGLYSVFTLYSTITDMLQEQGFKISPDPIISFLPFEPTQSVNIAINYTNSSFSFDPLLCPNPMNTLLGYDKVTYASSVTPYLYKAPYVSKFNVNDYYLLRCSITSSSFFVNKYQNQIIAQIPADVPIGYQIAYSPENPNEIECNNLSGCNLQTLEVELLNQKMEPLSIPEYWSCQLDLSWYELPENRHTRGF